MSKSKKQRDLGYKKWEATGDAILLLVVSENLHRLPRSIEGSFVIHYLTSNKMLAKVRSSYKFPFKFKGQNPITVDESKGDEVEYYIAFLYYNYGLESARRFVFNHIIARHIIL